MENKTLEKIKDVNLILSAKFEKTEVDEWLRCVSYLTKQNGANKQTYSSINLYFYL